MGDYIGILWGFIKGDTRSLDYSSCYEWNLCKLHDRGDTLHKPGRHAV